MTPDDNAGTLFMQSFLTAQTLKRFAVCGLVFLAFFSASPISVSGTEINGEIPPAPPTAPSPPTAPTPAPPPQDNQENEADPGGNRGGQVCHLPGALLNPYCWGLVFAIILHGLNMALSFVLYFIGVIFDFVLEYSIHGTTAPNPEDPGGVYRSDAIVTAWHILRDIINLALIFVLLYVAIGTVLNIQSIDWRKQVAQIIIAAIFVNFSLFLTRIVIDAGNIVAFNFHQQLTTIERENEPAVQVGISERFMGILGIPRINELAAVDRDGDIDRVTGGWAGVAVGIMRIVVTLIAMWVFFSAAILFIGRTLALFLLLILSPIGVAGASLPLLGSHAAKWRSTLFSQAFLPAIFLFLTFVVLLFFDEESANIMATADGQFGENLALPIQAHGGYDPEGLFIMYILVAAALIMTIRITKSLSGQVGEMTNKGISALSGVALGGTALVGRKVVGGAAGWALKTKAGGKILEATSSSNLLARTSSRLAFSAMDRAHAGSFDPRTIKAFGVGDRLTKQLGAVGRKEGGREADVKRAAERVKDDRRYKRMTPEQLKKEAELHEKTWWLPGKGVSLARAKELREMARRKQTSSEDREKRIGDAAKKVEDNLTDPLELEKILGDLHSNELPFLPPETLMKPEVIAQLNIGDLQSIKSRIDRTTRNKIVAEINRLSASPPTPTTKTIDPKVVKWINRPNSGYI